MVREELGDGEEETKERVTVVEEALGAGMVSEVGSEEGEEEGTRRRYMILGRLARERPHEVPGANKRWNDRQNLAIRCKARDRDRSGRSHTSSGICCSRNIIAAVFLTQFQALETTKKEPDGPVCNARVYNSE